MATSILDTLVGQAKTGLSRAYLITGVVPAASLLAGWRLYDRGLQTLQEDLKNAFGSTTSWTSSVIFGALVLACVGGMFFVGRTLVLRVLQSLPGRLLSLLRQHLLATQVSRWWTAQKRKSEVEYRLTPLVLAIENDFDANLGNGVATPDKLPPAVAASQEARTRLAWMASSDPWTREPETAEIESIVNGLTALYSLPAISDGGAGAAERNHWKKLVGSTPGVRDFISRIHGELYRELLHQTAQTREQPDDERWLAPTRLGNRVAALDDYAERRYNIGTSTLWIRLWGVLDDKDKKEVADAQMILELLANLTIAFAVLALLILGSSAGNLGRLMVGRSVDAESWKALAFVGGSLMLSVACYRTGIFAFSAVAERIIRLVDLHRLRLITSVGYAAPKTVGEELQIFGELNSFFASAKERKAERELTSPATPKASSGSGSSLLTRIKP